MKESLKNLRDKIIKMPEKLLENFPESEQKNLGNYAFFPIELLIKADWNYKEDDEKKSEKLRNNIKRNGQIENIHVSELETGYFEVINGNHRLDDFIKMGRQFVFVYDHGKISQTDAYRICIETNESEFEANNIKLSGIIKDMLINTSIEDLSSTLFFSQEELTDLQNLADFSWSDYKEQDLGDMDPLRKEKEIVCPSCGHKFSV